MLSWVKKKYEGAEEAGGRAYVYFDVLMTFYDKKNGGQHVTYKGHCTADGNKVAFDSEGGNSLRQLLSEQTFTIKKPTFHLVSENTLAKGSKYEFNNTPRSLRSPKERYAIINAVTN